MKKILILLLCLLSVDSFADAVVTIYNRDASEIDNLQRDLEILKNSEHGSPEIDELLIRAGQIAEMNNRCATIDLTEMLDESCGHFYTIELPEFENQYLQVTGEARLNAVTMETEMGKREQQIFACVDALQSVVVSKEQMILLSGDFDAEPLSEGKFDITYNYLMSWNENLAASVEKSAARWMMTCRNIVYRKGGVELAPLFIDQLDSLNKILAKKKNVKVSIDKSEQKLYLESKQKISGTYRFNGAFIFGYVDDKNGWRNSLLVMDLKNGDVSQPAIANSDYFKPFEGRVTFNNRPKTGLFGSWAWDFGSEKNKLKGEFAEGYSINSGIDYLERSTDWLKVGAISTAALAGVSFVLGIVFHTQAVDIGDKKPASEKEYKKNLDDIESKQTLRNVFYGVGALGLAVSATLFVLDF